MRISTTTLDYFNSYLNDDCWRCRGGGTVEVKGEAIICPNCEGTGVYMTKEKFIESIKKPFVQTRKMLIGSTLHSIIENPAHPDIKLQNYQDANGVKQLFIQLNDLEINIHEIDKMLSVIDNRFPFEIKTTNKYSINGEDIILVGMADQIAGKTIYEHKFTFKYDYEKYANSLQWRCYCFLYGVEKVTYKVFITYDNQSGIRIGDIKTFDMYSYYNLEKDILDVLETFVYFIHENGLEEYFSNENKVMVDDFI